MYIHIYIYKHTHTHTQDSGPGVPVIIKTPMQGVFAKSVTNTLMHTHSHPPTLSLSKKGFLERYAGPGVPAIYMYIYACMYVYKYIYIHTHTHTHTHTHRTFSSDTQVQACQ